MRPIGWLHISDFHLRVNHSWAQDAVLSAMRDDIIRRRKAGAIFDFVLATGDIAYAGKAPEYKLAVAFFDELAAATAVPREKSSAFRATTISTAIVRKCPLPRPRTFCTAPACQASDRWPRPT
jgi:3',5'-cyclic AMP phosphodiesterase CpdA